MAVEGKDKLTGLLTEQYLRQDLENEFKRASRFSREMAFVLFEPAVPVEVRADVLYPALKALARVCEGRIRQIDVGVRWGQQILLILPETGREGADIVVSKVQTGFAEKPFQHPQTGEPMPIALKCVVQVFPADGPDRDSILYNLRENLQAGDGKPPS